MTARVAVVGGGASGIAAAHYLIKAGLPVDLYECDPTLGGRIAPADFFGRELCFGGKNIGHKYSELRAFLREYGDPKFERFGINTSRATAKGTQLVDSKAPLSTVATVAASLTLRDLYRLASLVLRHMVDRSLGDAGSKFYARKAAAHGYPALDRYFSAGASAAIIRAATVRMNGAEPDEISLDTFGSNLQMLLDQYEQPANGFSASFEAFGRALNLFCNTTVLQLLGSGGGLELRARRGGEVSSRTYSDVVIALPAGAASSLLQDHAPEVAVHLRQVRYYPVAVVLAQYDAPIFSSSRRAMLFSANDVVSNAGAYGIHDLDLVRYTVSGRAARGQLDADPKVWIEEGERQLRAAGLLTSQNRIHWQARTMTPGLCGYAPRHARFLDELAGLKRKYAGLHLTGDFVKGASLENCFRAAKSAVAEITARHARGPAPTSRSAQELSPRERTFSTSSTRSTRRAERPDVVERT